MMTYCPWDVTIQKKINGGKKKKNNRWDFGYTQSSKV